VEVIKKYGKAPVENGSVVGVEVAVPLPDEDIAAHGETTIVTGSDTEIGIEIESEIIVTEIVIKIEKEIEIENDLIDVEVLAHPVKTNHLMTLSLNKLLKHQGNQVEAQKVQLSEIPRIKSKRKKLSQVTRLNLIPQEKKAKPRRPLNLHPLLLSGLM
jgi:hypothetical protein